MRGTGVAAGLRPAARWIDPVCPRAIGVAPEIAALVVARVRAAAIAAGAKVAEAKCRPNLTVSFVDDAADVARRVAKRQPRQFADIAMPDRRALIEGDAPVRWWYITELRGKDGERLEGNQPPFVTIDGGTPGQQLPGGTNASYLALPGNSLVSTQVARTILRATVLVDANRATGARLDAVADYAAFVGLAEVRPDPDPQPGSILGLFTGTDAPAALTEWDRRFLRQVYRIKLDRQARQHRSSLVAALVDEEPKP